MGMISIGTILGGGTILYAGILSLADGLYVGALMILVGGIITAMPIWNWIRKPIANPLMSSGKARRKAHLKVVEDRDKSPTYH